MYRWRKQRLGSKFEIWSIADLGCTNNLKLNLIGVGCYIEQILRNPSRLLLVVVKQLTNILEGSPVKVKFFYVTDQLHLRTDYLGS